MSSDRCIVFFGTPDFAVPTLDALCREGRAPARVVSQPARAAGRGRKPRQPPVAARALELGLRLMQPHRVRDDEFLRELALDEPWVGIVVAFGQIFPPSLLELPAEGCINLHASLLPKYRGAAPIQAAIGAGETVTGVTTMRMVEGLDSGPVLLTAETPIGGAETAAELTPRLALMGAELTVETLRRLDDGSLEPTPQDDDLATYARRLKKEDGRLDWALSAGEIYDRYRAYQPWPGVAFDLKDESVRVESCVPVDSKPHGSSAPGTFLGLDVERAVVACGHGTALGLDSVRRAGRGAVAARDFVNGLRLRAGDLLRSV